MCHVVTFHVLSLSFSCPFFCVHLCFICSSALGYLSLSFTLSLCQFVCFVPSSSVYLVMFYLRSSPVSSCYSGLYFVLLCALGLVLFFFFFFFCQSFLPSFCFLHFGFMDYSFPSQLHLGLSPLFAIPCQMHQFLFWRVGCSHIQISLFLSSLCQIIRCNTL